MVELAEVIGSSFHSQILLTATPLTTNVKTAELTLKFKVEVLAKSEAWNVFRTMSSNESDVS
jgi:hypothetical protein